MLLFGLLAQGACAGEQVARSASGPPQRSVNTNAAIVSMNVNASAVPHENAAAPAGPSATPMSPPSKRPAIQGLTIFLFSELRHDVKADLIITDPLGRRVGYDPRTKTEIEEMPLEVGSYGRVGTGPDYLHGEGYLHWLEAGEYVVEIIGAEPEVCAVEILAHHADRNPTDYYERHIKLRRHGVVAYRVVIDGDEAVVSRLRASN
jgi:hypothetical protein